MLTTGLLEKISETPLNVKRYSTKFTRRKYFGAKVKADSFPLPLEMKREFSEIFRSMDVQSKYPCITARNPGRIDAVKYDIWVEFFKALCDNANPINLTQAILCAAVKFIKRYPGSLFHEFMMLHQLREILKFTDSADYDNEIFSKEQEVLKKIFEIHILLEGASSRAEHAHQALHLIGQTPYARTALLVLECYHISQASLDAKKKFDARAHEIKNFRFMLELAFMPDVNLVNTEFVSPTKLTPIENLSLKIVDERVQSVTLAGVDAYTISQPKKLGSHWQDLFQKLADLANIHQSPVTMMTEILKSDSTFFDRLLVWFGVLGEYNVETNNFEMAHKNYVEIFNFLKDRDQLPKDAKVPIHTTVSIDTVTFSMVNAGIVIPEPERESISFNVEEEQQDAASQQQLLDDEALAMVERAAVAETLAKLVQNVEEQAEEQLRKVEDSGVILRVPLVTVNSKSRRNSTNNWRERMLTPLREDQGAYNPDYSGGLEAITEGSQQTDGTSPFPDLEGVAVNLFFQDGQRDLNVSLLDENDDLSSIDGNSVAGSVLSHMSERSHEYEPFESKDSAFAEQFMSDICKCISQNMTDKNLTIILKDLIRRTLRWHKAANQLGLQVQALYTLRALEALTKKEQVVLKEAYVHLYAILHATVFATRLKKSRSVDLRPYYQDAGATLMQLRGLVKSPGFLQHVNMLQDQCTFERSRLAMLIYVDEKKCTDLSDKRKLSNKEKQMDGSAEKILEKLPFIWTEFYKAGSLEQAAKILEKRREIEEMCAHMLTEILSKETGTLTMTEQAFVVRVVEDYSLKNTKSPFYNGLQFLAVTSDIEDTVALLGSELARAREQKLCRELYKQATPFTYADENSTHQERFMNRLMWTCLNNMVPQAEAFLGDNEDWETKSMLSATSSHFSHQSGKSSSSAYTYRSTGSSRSSYLHKPHSNDAAVIKQAGFESVWASYCAKKSPLSKDEIKFVLKNFEALIQETDIDKAQSVKLLNRVFDWLGALPCRKLTTSISSLFSSKETADLPHADFDGYMGYVVPKKDKVPYLFVEYCAYQAQKGMSIKNYEVDFIKQHIQHLSLHKDALEVYDQHACNAAISLEKVIASAAVSNKK